MQHWVVVLHVCLLQLAALAILGSSRSHSIILTKLRLCMQHMQLFGSTLHFGQLMSTLMVPLFRRM